MSSYPVKIEEVSKRLLKKRDLFIVLGLTLALIAAALTLVTLWGWIIYNLTAVSPSSNQTAFGVGMFTIFLTILCTYFTLKWRQNVQSISEREETFRTAMEHSPIGMGLAEPDGRWLKVNKALCDMLGYDKFEMMKQDFTKITHPGDLEYTKKYIDQMLAGKMAMHQMEKRYLHKDGHTVWVQMSVSLVRKSDGTARYFIAQVEDISSRKKIEQMKKEFISTVSHELRTPLTSIRGSLGLIEGGVTGILPEKAAELVKIAYKNSERLVRIINDILDIEKIESGKMEIHLKKVPIEAFLHSAIEANKAYGEKFGVHFAIGQSMQSEIMADPDRLMQVMSNLMSNAAKFSPEDTEVDIRAIRNGNNIRIEIKDHGIGIAEEFRSQIFEKFSQADASSTRKREGTGLGLSIAKQLVEAMHGHIGFHTETGKGTTFYFDLPEAQDIAAQENILCAS